jgi:hypothetical protein
MIDGRSLVKAARQARGVRREKVANRAGDVAAEVAVAADGRKAVAGEKNNLRSAASGKKRGASLRAAVVVGEGEIGVQHGSATIVVGRTATRNESRGRGKSRG